MKSSKGIDNICAIIGTSETKPIEQWVLTRTSSCDGLKMFQKYRDEQQITPMRLSQPDNCISTADYSFSSGAN
ncbi:hypothetical protein E4H04_05480 [Candidatus Bathyarchaeota archaeon]|nr:MAG: hypothetical protein E4H04_05480 [Candidatus Bathyarchaeota archaeon]